MPSQYFVDNHEKKVYEYFILLNCHMTGLTLHISQKVQYKMIQPSEKKMQFTLMKQLPSALNICYSFSPMRRKMNLQWALDLSGNGVMSHSFFSYEFYGSVCFFKFFSQQCSVFFVWHNGICITYMQNGNSCFCNRHTIVAGISSNFFKPYALSKASSLRDFHCHFTSLPASF